MTTGGTPVVFIHGLWLHASSWQPWIDRFSGAGYAPIAPGWPGDRDTVGDTRAHADRVAGHGINDVVSHYAEVIRGLASKPVVIGHSFGGLIVQRLLGEDLAAAGVAIDPAPIKGIILIPPSALRVASVALLNPGNRTKSVSLTKDQFRYGFGNAISEQESEDLYDKWTIPSPGRPLFEGAFATFAGNSPAQVNTGNTKRGPLLVTAGGKDHAVPASISKTTVSLYSKSPAKTELKSFPDRGHSLTIDKGWQQVADSVLAWLKANSL